MKPNTEILILALFSGRGQNRRRLDPEIKAVEGIVEDVLYIHTNYQKGHVVQTEFVISNKRYCCSGILPIVIGQKIVIHIPEKYESIQLFGIQLLDELGQVTARYITNQYDPEEDTETFAFVSTSD